MKEKIDKTNAVFAIQTYNCKLKKNKRSKLAQQHYKVDMNGSEWPYIGNYASELHLIKDKDNTLFERNKTTFYGTLNLWRTRVSTDTEEYLSRVQTCQMQLHPGFPRWQRDSLARLDTYLSATYADPGICSLSHANKGGNSQQWTRGGDSVSCEVVHLGILFLYLRAACILWFPRQFCFVYSRLFPFSARYPRNSWKSNWFGVFPKLNTPLPYFSIDFKRIIHSRQSDKTIQDKRGYCSECFNRNEKDIQDIHKEIIIIKYSADDCIVGFERF